MQKILVTSVLASVLLLLTILACDSEVESIEVNDQNVTNYSKRVIDTENQFEDLFTFPIGTELWIENNELNFILPKGYLLVLKSNNYNKNSKKVVSVISGSVRCKCTEGKGCSPYTVGDQSGCSTDNNSCTKCEMSTGISTFRNSKSLEDFNFIDAEIVNLNEDIEFLVDEAKVYEAKSPKGFIFDSPEIQEKIINFISGFNSTEDDNILANKGLTELPEDYRYTPIKFSGKLLFVPLNINSSVSAKMAEVSISAAHSCTCNEGSGCKKGSKLTPKGTLRYCDAGNCSDCELSN